MRIKAKSALYLPYTQHWKLVWSAIMKYSTARCEKRIINNETRWHIQVYSAKVSLLTEVFAQDIIQNHLIQDGEVDGWVILETNNCFN